MQSRYTTVIAIGVTLGASCFGCAPPQQPPGPVDLVLEGLSIYATMPDANGERQVTTSFRITNRGTATAPASIADVQSADGATIIGTPALPRNAIAYFAATAITTLDNFTVRATADIAGQVQETSEDNNVASFEVGNASVGRWRPL